MRKFIIVIFSTILFIGCVTGCSSGDSKDKNIFESIISDIKGSDKDQNLENVSQEAAPDNDEIYTIESKPLPDSAFETNVKPVGSSDPRNNIPNSGGVFKDTASNSASSETESPVVFDDIQAMVEDIGKIGA